MKINQSGVADDFPLVSIVMNCYNGEKYLREAIDSIVSQSYQNWELIFWDNKSTDSSQSIFDSYKDSRFKYFLSDNHTTLYKARNFALNCISGEYICFLDVDDIWMPDKIKSQITVLTQNKDIVLLHSAYYERNEKSGVVRKKVKHSQGYVKFESYLHSYFINIQSVMLRNIADVDIYFNDQLDILGDYELFMKLAYIYPTYYIKDPLVVSRFDGNNLSKKLYTKWPKEILIANISIKKLFRLSDKGMGKMLDMKLAKRIYFMSIFDSNYIGARSAIKDYIFIDLRSMLFYLATFSKFLSLLMLKLKKFNV
jgi:glycosyltransferase involved in cell wall biosynthesis